MANITAVARQFFEACEAERLANRVQQIVSVSAAIKRNPSPKFPASWENTGKFMNFGL
jgi:hypothetical protein